MLCWGVFRSPGILDDEFFRRIGVLYAPAGRRASTNLFSCGTQLSQDAIRPGLPVRAGSGKSTVRLSALDYGPLDAGVESDGALVNRGNSSDETDESGRVLVYVE